MMNITFTTSVEIDERELRDVCIDAIQDCMQDNMFGAEFVDIPLDMRRTIYAKVGALLIDYAGEVNCR